jgi:FkbM family methyltransferase
VSIEALQKHMRETFNKIRRWHIEAPLLRIFLRRDYKGPTIQLSHWIIPKLESSTAYICYCAGVGEDIEFELGLIKQFGATVFAFDPTPRAIHYIQRNSPALSTFKFLPVGLWSSDVVLQFFAPENPQHVSHSVFKEGMREAYFDAPCKTLSTLMNELGHTQIDVLKMNIEGAEYEVLKNMMAENIRPMVIALTFEGSSAFVDAIRWTSKLRKYGYQFAGLNRWAATFVLGEADRLPV